VLIHILPVFLLGWTAVAGPILGSMVGKKGAKSAANQAAQSQQQLMQQALAEYAQGQAKQRQGVMGMAGMTNPFQQAAQGSSPFFSAPGQDVATFGPGSMAGTQTTPAPNNAFFTQPLGPMTAPPPAPANTGWGGGLNHWFGNTGGVPRL
jgi:type II secretory pathway pseudopilin PulG